MEGSLYGTLHRHDKSQSVGLANHPQVCFVFTEPFYLDLDYKYPPIQHWAVLENGCFMATA